MLNGELHTKMASLQLQAANYYLKARRMSARVWAKVMSISYRYAFLTLKFASANPAQWTHQVTDGKSGYKLTPLFFSNYFLHKKIPSNVKSHSAKKSFVCCIFCKQHISHLPLLEHRYLFEG